LHSDFLTTSSHFNFSLCFYGFFSESLGETRSSAGFVVRPPYGGVSGQLFNESNTRTPCDIDAKVAELRLLVEAREKTLAECSNQLVKMRSDLEMKDHQLALKYRQLMLRDHRVAD
jgi:hypothetical protein